MQSSNEKFKKDIIQRSFDFSVGIIKYLDNLQTSKSSRIIESQVIRSSTSIGANIVEAQASSSRKEFKRFMEISLKSANETSYWLKLLLRTQKTKGGFETNIDHLVNEVNELSKILGASIITLKQTIK